MSVNVDYELNFQSQFTDAVYSACTPVAKNDEFKEKVKEAVSSIIIVLRRFTGLARMSKLLTLNNKTYKVTVNRPV
jgi:hypothetical protein